MVNFNPQNRHICGQVPTIGLHFRFTTCGDGDGGWRWGILGARGLEAPYSHTYTPSTQFAAEPPAAGSSHCPSSWAPAPHPGDTRSTQVPMSDSSLQSTQHGTRRLSQPAPPSPPSCSLVFSFRPTSIPEPHLRQVQDLMPPPYAALRDMLRDVPRPPHTMAMGIPSRPKSASVPIN